MLELLLFVDLDSGRRKFVTQIPEEVIRDFSSLPFTSDIYVYIFMYPFLLGFKMFASDFTGFVCS